MKKQKFSLMIPYIFLVMAKVNMPHHGKEPSGHTGSQIDQAVRIPRRFQFKKCQGVWIKQHNGMGPVCILGVSPWRRILGNTIKKYSFEIKKRPTGEKHLFHWHRDERFRYVKRHCIRLAGDGEHGPFKKGIFSYLFCSAQILKFFVI
jgi:hypothetical protein